MKQADFYKNRVFLSGIFAVIALFGLMALGITAEVPQGSLRGTVLMAESGAGLPGADVILLRKTQDQYEGDDHWRAVTDASGSFSIPYLPAGLYVMSVYGKAHEIQTRLAVNEGKLAEVEVKAPRAEPALAMHAGSRVFSPNQNIKIRFDGNTTGKTVELQGYRVDESRLRPEVSLQDLLYAVSSGRNRFSPDLVKSDDPALSQTYQLTTKDIEGVFVQEFDLGSLPEGVYLLEAKTEEMARSIWLTVTKIALITKADDTRIQAFVCDIDTGDPVPGAEVRQLIQGRGVIQKTTDQKGMAQLEKAGGIQGQALVSAKLGKSSAHTWFYNTVGGETKRAFFTFDRPIYRPGDKVHYKGTFRVGEPNTYSIPKGQAIDVKIMDDSGTVIQSDRKTLDEFGVLDGEFTIAESAEPGGYSLIAESGNWSEYAYIPIANYRRPYFDINVIAKKSTVIRGEPLEFTVKCTAYTGEPIVGAKVSADLMYQYRYDSPVFEEEGWYSDSYEEGGDYDRQYVGTTDANGEMKVVVETRAPSRNNEFADLQNIEYTLVASVEDAGGRYYSDSGSGTAYRGLFDVQANWNLFVAAPGSIVNLNINSAALPDGGVLPDSLKVQIFREYYEKNVASRVKLATEQVAGTGGSVTFKPDRGGSYIARVEGRDSRGNTVATEAYLYVTGGGRDSAGPSGTKITLDQKDYKVGDVATVVLTDSALTGSAWLTVVGDGLLKSEIVDLAHGELVYKIPVTKQMQPNFSVAITQVRKHQFSEVQADASVDISDHILNVSVTPDREKIRPGESVRFAIETKDDKGQPVPADVALGVVDEGIYQIMEDGSLPEETFYPKRYTYIQTSYSFPEIYLDGEDKGGGTIDVRKNFADTAAWMPRVRTDQTGRAVVDVRVPDNLTSWRATATAISAATAVGKATSNVISTKELMLRFSLPSFLTQDDEQDIAITVTNGSDKSYKATVHFQSSGGALLGDAQVTVTVDPGQTQSILRRIRVTEPGELTFKAVATSSEGFNDGLEQSVKIQPRGREDVSFFAGQVAGKAYAATLNLSDQALSGQLEVQVAPDLLTSVVPSLDELIEYPYGCTEQTVSRFVPAVLVQSRLKQSGIAFPDLDRKVKKAIRLGMARLRALQKSDGTFGWFEYGDTDPVMTAIAIDGMARAQEVGFQELNTMLEDAVNGAAEYLKRVPERDYQWNLTLAAQVARFRASEPAFKILSRTYKESSLGDLATEALGLHRLSAHRMASAAPIAKARFDEMRKKFFGAGQTLSFGDVRETSMALDTVLEIDPASTDADRLVQTLIQSRGRGEWSDTWRTSSAIKAIVHYIDQRQIAAASGTVRVLVNGSETGRIATGALSAPGTIKVPFASLKKGGNKIQAVLDGSGTGFVAVKLTQFIHETESKPVAKPAGFRLAREYVRMESVRLEDGSLRLRPSKQPTYAYRSGDVFRCRLTIQAPTEASYLVVEDPIPSNTRIVDADKPEPGFDWMNWWSNSSFFDNRATFFIWRLVPGQDNVIEYAIRAESDGVCIGLPARVYPMYQPDVMASTNQTKLLVRR